MRRTNGVNYAFRRFGNADGEAPPLLFLQHFRGNLYNWDPLLVDSLAADREVVLLDNAGVGLSSGRVPGNVTQMARDAIAFSMRSSSTTSISSATRWAGWWPRRSLSYAHN